MSKKSDSTIKDNQKNQRIQVFARTRPLNGSEIKQHSRNILEVCAEKREIRVRDGKMTNKAFAFDRVFGPETSQIQVYQVVVGPLIQEVLMGYNCTVFAYGQTSTGKTFTMEGERSDKSCTWDEDPKAGIIPRSLHQLFEELYKEENVEFSVHVSFLELYNEELFDLLSPNEVHIAKLRLFEDSARKGSVVIQGLEEIKVNSKDEVYAILERGTIRRQTAATHLNASSSRSHTVFSVTVHIKENTIDGEELLKTGKLNLVDLAGSENIGRSGASQKTAREAGNINQSLLTLGRVITALVEKAPHVPYRESKLTRLLQDSLGGHTKTSIIATVSPASCNTEETISTLDYAQRAKSITIKPEVNQKMTKKALIKEYTEEIERLRKDLVAARDNNLGIFIHKDNFRSMEELKEVNENLISKNKELFESLAETQNALEDTKIQLDDTTTKYNESTAECENLEKELSKTLKTLKHTQRVLDQTGVQRDEKQYIIGIQSETEQKLTQQANTLLEVAHESTKNLFTLHNTVERKTNVQLSNDELSQEFQTKFLNKLNTINGIISEIAKEQSSNLNAIEVDISGVLESCQRYYSEFRNCFIEKFDEEFQRQAEISAQMFMSGQEDHVKFCDVNIQHVSGFKIENDQLTHGLRFLMERHASMKENWIAFIAKLTERFIAFRMQTKSKLQQLEEQIKSSASAHKTLTDDLVKLFEEFSSQQMQQSQWCDNQISSITVEKLQYDKKIEEKLQVMLNALSSIQSLKEEETQRLNDKAATFHDAHNQNVESIKTAGIHHNSKIESFNQEELAKTLQSVVIVQHLCKSHEDQENEINEECKSVLAEQANVNKEMMATFLLSEDSVKAQKDELVHLETLTNEEKGKLKEAKDRHPEQVEIAKRIAGQQISNMKLHVKLQEEDLIPHFTNQLRLVSNTRKRVLESTDSLRNECSDCGTRVKRFLEEELQKDIPSGNTPKRKCYIISDDLAKTSPHEKILERRRLQIDLDGTRTLKNSHQDSSSDNSQDSPQLKRRIMSSKDTLSIADNCSSSDESTTCYSDTYSSQPDLTSDSSRNNKENQRSPSKKSKIPKKKKTPKKAVIKAQTSTRKPFTSSNVPLQQ